jgi:uncharacterized membrane protein
MRLSQSDAAWLDAQASGWVSAGFIDEATKTRILGAYSVESAEGRGLIALVLLGALMFGVGVLL